MCLDGLQAMNNIKHALDTTCSLDPRRADQDMILAIKHKIEELPTEIEFEWAEGHVDVGTTIACVFGVHVGTVAVVTGSTKCEFIDANGKTRKVTKQHARRVVASIPTKPTKKRKLVAQERSLKTEPRSNCKKNI